MIASFFRFFNRKRKIMLIKGLRPQGALGFPRGEGAPEGGG